MKQQALAEKGFDKYRMRPRKGCVPDEPADRGRTLWRGLRAYPLSIVVLLIGILFQNVAAADFEDRTVVTRASSKLIETILVSIDPGYVEVGNNLYVFDVQGRYRILIHNNERDISLQAYFSGGRVSFSRINEWNRRTRFSTAYLDNDNDPVLEAHLDFEGGVTGESIYRFISLFATSVEAFANEIR